MAFEKKEVLVAKEAHDVVVLLVGLIEGIKAKKSVAELAAKELPDLMAAFDGFSQISGEAKENPKAFYSTLGAGAGEIAHAILG